VCEEILRVILDDDALVVCDVIVQDSERNIYGRSVRLDALCILGTGERTNIEVQRSDNDNHLKRARFNAASITVKDSNPGDRFENVVDVCIVYISQFDLFKRNKTLYHVDKVLRETGEMVDDGLSEVFVNTKVNDGSTVAELMECFLQKEVNNPKFPKLSNRMKILKSTESEAHDVRWTSVCADRSGTEKMLCVRLCKNMKKLPQGRLQFKQRWKLILNLELQKRKPSKV
jgi:hypothetical protein